MTVTDPQVEVRSNCRHLDSPVYLNRRQWNDIMLRRHWLTTNATRGRRGEGRTSSVYLDRSTRRCVVMNVCNRSLVSTAISGSVACCISLTTASVHMFSTGIECERPRAANRCGGDGVALLLRPRAGPCRQRRSPVARPSDAGASRSGRRAAVRPNRQTQTATTPAAAA
jgi:hypothetical protein